MAVQIMDDDDGFMGSAYIQHTNWDLKEGFVQQITVTPNQLPTMAVYPWNPYTDPAFFKYFPQIAYPFLYPMQPAYTYPHPKVFPPPKYNC
ncbi:hypothetical protein [Bacillus horti]|uniref:Spore coat protein n=1 Tax=Caldalkalibacillus horti TaxID=77523 RepID=A0ABT9W0B1_9BACI|nr:hypothetical protein [Bacillus horti]MDQ0166679.1 hypothetical protein [Bacillus horti]